MLFAHTSESEQIRQILLRHGNEVLTFQAYVVQSWLAHVLERLDPPHPRAVLLSARQEAVRVCANDPHVPGQVPYGPYT